MQKGKSVLIKSTDITHLTFSVSEKIDQKHLLSFLRTNIKLKLNSIIEENNILFYYNFIETNLTYEVILFSKESNFLLEPFLSLEYYDTNMEDTTDLFIYDDFFVIFKDKKFFAFKHINDISKDDIVSYATQYYEIYFDNIIVVDENLYKKLIDLSYKNKKQNRIKFLPLKENKQFFVFVLYSFIILLFTTYILFFDTNSPIEIQPDRYKDEYLVLKDIYKKKGSVDIDKVVKFFDYLKLFNITLEDFQIEKNIAKTTLIQKDKDKLYDFLHSYSKKIDILKISYDKNSKKYKMDIKIEL